MVVPVIIISITLFCLMAMSVSCVVIMELSERRWGSRMRAMVFGMFWMWLAAVFWVAVAAVSIHAVARQ